MRSFKTSSVPKTTSLSLFKVYLHQSSSLVSIAKITPNIDLNVLDTSDKSAKFLNVEYKSITANVADRAAVLGMAILICVHRCMKELHQIFETHQKNQI